MVGDLGRLAEHCFATHEEFIVAGVVTAEVEALFPGVPVGSRSASAGTLLRLSRDAIDHGRQTFRPLEPVTTRSALEMTGSPGNGDG